MFINFFPKSKKTTTPILLFLLTVCLLSCSASGKFKSSYNPNSIPADLKKPGYVLLVFKQEIGGFANTQNRGVEKMMQKYYGAPFEMVSVTDIKNPKYNDTDKYRYFIGRDFNSGTIVTTTTYHDPQMRGNNTTTHREYHEETIYDRKLNKAFPSIGYPSASYSLGMKAFAQFMQNR